MKENDLLKTRHTYQKVFQTAEGKAVLTDMLNELGFFATDPEYIKPELLSFAHLLLQRLGVNVIQNIGNYIGAVVDCATDIDVIQEDENV